jgi:hypothetical protein
MLFFPVSWALGLYFAQGSLAQWTVGQEVKTSSGAVAGHASKIYPQVSEYLGIRFGQTTEGANRFMPPKAYNSSEKIVGAEYVIISRLSFGKKLIHTRERMDKSSDILDV